MIKPLVSISCITFNQVNYIKQCLNGFLMQKTNFGYEILIHDDCSNDGTKEIIEDYVEKYPNLIRPIYQTENQYSQGVRGMMVRYNFSRAKGKYIAMCEGDDYWTDPLKLQKQVDVLEANPTIDICSHRSNKFNDEKKIFIGVIGDNGEKTKVIPTREVILNYGRVSPMQSILIRNCKIDEFKTLSLNAFGGHGILQVLWSYPNGVFYLPDVMGVYRFNSENSITKHILTNKKYQLNVLKTQIKKLNELDTHFNFIHTTEFFVKITEVNQKILSSGIIPVAEKLNFLKTNNIKTLTFLNIIYLIKGFMSSLKFKIKTIFFRI